MKLISGAVLLVAIVAAPWMYGSTRHWALIRLNEILSFGTAAWIGTLAVEWRKPKLPMLLWCCVPLLFIQGWFLSLGKPPFPPDPFTVHHIHDLATRWPGSFIVKTPVETMWLFSGLFGALLMTVDLAKDHRWWNAIYATITVTGASIVLLGIVQDLTGARAILWQTDVPNADNFFGTYFHHSSGGAFINLVWPLAMGALLSMLNRHTPRWQKIAGGLLCGSMLVIDLCGPCAQLSRFAQVNTVILLVLFATWYFTRLPRTKRLPVALGTLACGFVLMFVISAVAIHSGKLPKIAERWHLFTSGLSEVHAVSAPPSLQMRPDGFIATPAKSDRWVGITTCFKMIPQAGFLGFGPGRWSTVFPHFATDPFLRTFFLWLQFAHNDFLQTLIEWGYIGGICWALLVAGGLRRISGILQAGARRGGPISPREPIFASIGIAVLGLLLHGTLDFPLQIPSIQLYFLLLLGLAWALKPNASPQNISETRTVAV
jgi:hypothetical protein